YDEAAIKEQFRNETFTRQLHVTKYYLRNLVMDALRSFHGNISKDAELKEILRNAEILFNKELYELCATELKKAEQLAEKYELYTGLYEVLNWKRKLKQALEPYNYEAFHGYVSKQAKALAVLENVNAHWQNMVVNTWQIMGSGIPRGIRTVKPAKAATLEAMVLEYNTAYLKHFGKNTGERELRRLLSVLERHPHRLREEPSPYVSTINNLVSYLVFGKRDDEALELIRKARAIYETFNITTEKKSMLKQVLRTYNLELEIYRSRKQRVDLSFALETAKFVEANKNKIPKDYLLSFWFQLADIYFGAGQYDAALGWLNHILNEKPDGPRADLQKQARMLNIIIHLEQKNYFVLRYFVDSTRRFIKKHSLMHHYDDALLRMFAKISNAPQTMHRRLYRQWYADLFPAEGETVIPEAVLDYIDYRQWLGVKAGVSKK
ncbi:MAG: hypothetical protein K8F30_11720, partial [Taibaiella sp.]|nr:hypothetical protein [Taibaiella sp.]